MNDKVYLRCPRCKYQWEKSLSELEKIETIYRLFRDEGKEEQKEVITYRAICPNDGTYIILEVKED